MTLQVAVDTVWLATATFLVLLMQAGFLLLEGGRVRAKNSINVAQKNLSDLVVSWVGFFVVGFFVMFGSSVPVVLRHCREHCFRCRCRAHELQSVSVDGRSDFDCGVSAGRAFSLG